MNARHNLLEPPSAAPVTHRANSAYPPHLYVPARPSNDSAAPSCPPRQPSRSRPPVACSHLTRVLNKCTKRCSLQPLPAKRPDEARGHALGRPGSPCRLANGLHMVVKKPLTPSSHISRRPGVSYHSDRSRVALRATRRRLLHARVWRVFVSPGLLLLLVLSQPSVGLDLRGYV